MNQRKENLAWALLGAAGYLIVLWVLVPIVYGIIDDRSMMEILSGQYLGHADPHAIFLGYWYSLFLAGLYRLVPHVDWYALGYLAMQAGCVSLILYRAAGWQKGRRRKTAVLSAVWLLIVLLCAQATVQLTFTTTAAVLGVTAIFWYLTTDWLKLTDLALIFVLGFLTDQVRASVFFMILPVCAVLWLARLRERERERRERLHRMLPLAVLAVLCLHLLGSQAGYGSPEWKAYQAYNGNRSLVYDYPDYTLPRFEDAEGFYRSLGIETKSRAKTLFYYNYTADAQIVPEFFGTYLEAYRETFPNPQTRWGRLLESGREYVEGLAGGRFHWQHTLVMLLYVLLILWRASSKDRRGCLEAAAAAGIQVLLWIYLLYEGRAPERVIYSMNLMLSATCLLLWREALKDYIPARRFLRMGGPVLMLLLFLLTVPMVRGLQDQNQEMWERNQDIEALKEYCMEHPQNFYFNDVTSLAFTTYNVRLWREEPYQMNYMSLGDWMSYSPVWREKLDGKGITSVPEALYGQEGVYLICSFDRGLEYLTSLYDGVRCVEVEKIPGFRVYELYRE